MNSHSAKERDSGVTHAQGALICGALVLIALWTYLGFLATVGPSLNHDEQNTVKIECFLHRDNADVHKLCVDHGYDR